MRGVVVGVAAGIEVVGIEVVATGATVVVGGTTGAVAGTISIFPVPSAVKMSVPWPSFARTEPEVNESDASPVLMARNVIVMTFPFAPVNPGFRAMPAKSTLPAAFENEGFCTHRFSTESSFDTERMRRLAELNKTSPDAAFIACIGEETSTVIVNVSPTATVLADGEKESVAMVRDILPQNDMVK